MTAECSSLPNLFKEAIVLYCSIEVYLGLERSIRQERNSFCGGRHSTPSGTVHLQRHETSWDLP